MAEGTPNKRKKVPLKIPLTLIQVRSKGSLGFCYAIYSSCSEGTLEWTSKFVCVYCFSMIKNVDGSDGW